MAFNDESLESWKRLPRHPIGWSELMHDSVGQRIAYAAQNVLPLEIVYSGLKSGMNRRTIRPIEAVRISGLIYIKAHCDLRQEKRTFRLDRIVGARVLGGPPSYSSEIPHRSLPLTPAQIPYDPNNSMRVAKDFSREFADQAKKLYITSNTIFWIALVAVLIVFYNMILNKGSGTTRLQPSTPQGSVTVTLSPKSGTETSAIIPPTAVKNPSEKLTLQSPPIAYPAEKTIPKVKTPSMTAKPKVEAVQPKASKSYFTVGSTEDEVLGIQGTPTSYNGNHWSYGFSSIKFREGRVVSWYSSRSNPLNVKMLPSETR